MTDAVSIPAIMPILPKVDTYNAVKIRIDEPKLNIPRNNNEKNSNDIYNAVDIKINKPSVEEKSIYDYPYNPEIVTADYIDVITLPSQTQEISDKTSVDEDKKKITPPSPNLTTLENEKLSGESVTFHGKDNKIEIIPSVEIKSEIDDVIANLKSNNYDTQAEQIANIAKLSFENPEEAQKYITQDVLSALINIFDKDNSMLEKPDDKKTDIRKKIILNELIKRKAGENKPVELPFQLTQEEIDYAMELTPFELAERNKEYAMYTVASLAKIYSDEVEKQTGMITPITDLPGISAIVESAAKNENPVIKLAVIDSLMHLYRPEYKNEIKSVLNILKQDKNEMVSQNATVILAEIQ